MKFYNGLNEEVDVDEINKAIQKDCQPYLRMIKQINDHVFTRGMKPEDDEIGKKRVRKDRIPRGMDEEVFEQFNKWLQDNNHNRRDKSVSVSKEANVLFGSRHFFFPIGKFSYTGIEAKDVNQGSPGSDGYAYAVESYLKDPDNFDTDYRRRLDKPFKDYFHTDEGIRTAYKNNFEVWFNCDAYYYVNTIGYEGNNVNKEIIKK